MNYIIKILLFLACASAALAQTTPIRNPQIQGTSGSIISGATLTNNGTFTNSATLNGAGTFNFGSGTVTLPATVSGLGSWAGSSSITTLGTITTGVWNGTTLAAGYGGTGQTSIAASVQALLDSISTTQGTILYNNGTDWVALAPGTSGHFLKTLGAGSNPLWAAAGGSGTGTVTSVAVSGSDGIEIDSGSPITTSGTIALGVNAAALSSHLGLGTMSLQPATSPTITTSIVTGSTSFTAFAGATTLLTLGGTGATATLLIPGTEAATGTAGVGAVSISGGLNVVKDSWINGVRVGQGAFANVSNTAVGNQSLASNSSGTENSAFGRSALLATTSGHHNAAFGHQSAYTLTTGSYNDAFGGIQALSTITSGVGNTAIGSYSLAGVSTSSDNVAIGYFAGAYRDSLQANLLLNPSDGVYIGGYCIGNADTESNAIVIGYDAIGDGSNTTVIGNSSTTQSHLFGTLLTDASTTTRAGFRLPHGTAPTTPTNGDIWTTSAGGLYAQINGATVGPIGASGLTIGTTTITSGTSGRVLYDNAGVVGELPLGTGVATALAINVGTAGAFVVNGGALGTPSSGTATNLTGTASGLTAGTVTTNANMTGDVTSSGSNATTIAAMTAPGPLLAENASIRLDPAGSADGKYTGTTVTGTAGATLAFGDVVVLDVTDSRWELADANSAEAADGDARAMLGICVLAAASDGDPTTILLHGIVRADTAFPTLTVGAPVYVGETAGDAVVTQPTTANVLIRMIGHALTGDEMFFNPDNSWMTHL